MRNHIPEDAYTRQQQWYKPCRTDPRPRTSKFPQVKGGGGVDTATDFAELL